MNSTATSELVWTVLALVFAGTTGAAFASSPLSQSAQVVYSADNPSQAGEPVDCKKNPDNPRCQK